MSNQSIEELLILFKKHHLEMHGYSPTFVPSPLTREWLVDQIDALQWYARYEWGTARAKPQEESYKKRPKIKKSSPF